MNNKTWLKPIVTLGPIGYYRGSGTWATIATLPIVYGMQYLFLPKAQILFVSVLAAIAYIVIDSALCLFDKHDPSEIVLDEVMGCLITFCGIPLNLTTLVAGVLIFRLLDITKPLIIGWGEKLPGAVGILADDIYAALITTIILRCLLVAP